MAPICFTELDLSELSPMPLRLMLIIIFIPFLGLTASMTREEGLDLAPYCQYSLNASTMPIEQVAATTHTIWQPISTSVVALGNFPGAVWLRCQITNATPNSDWVITSRYPFSTKIQLYTLDEKGKWISAVSGSALEDNEKTVVTREDALPVKLPTGKTIQVYLRYESEFTKIFFLQAMPLTHLRRTEEAENRGFFAYTAVLFLIALLNIFLAYKTSNLLPIYYIAALLLSFVYQCFEFGIGFSGLFPATRSAHLLMAFGGLALIAYALFLRALLSLQITIPRLSKFLIVLSAVLTLYALACFFARGYVLPLQLIGRGLYFILTGAVFYGVFRVYFMGFRPALYSGYGLVVLFVAQTTYLLNMSGITHLHGYAVKFLLPIGQIIEFIFFFRSVLIRITDQDDLLKIYRIESANELRAAEKDQSTSHRLTAAEGDAALKRLHRAFDGDKVYRQEELSLMSLAEKIGLTRHELSELFNTRLNTTFYEFLSEHRIREAQTLLENDRSARVLDIAMAVGFNSKSTFNKEFRRVTGKSPTEFRDEK